MVVNVYYDSTPVRTGFRIYFLVLTALIGIIGGFCVTMRVKLKLLKDKHANLNEMTGWVRGAYPLFTMLHKLKALPGGWLGIVMILMVAFTLVESLSLSYFIKPAYLFDRCLFTTGLVVNNTGVMNFPDPNNAAFSYAIDALAFAASNANITGLESYANAVGVYTSFDENAAFLPGSQDIIGRWRCDNTTAQPISYNGENDTTIANDLSQRGLLYPLFQATSRQNFAAGNQTFSGPSQQLVILSYPDVSLGDQWDIKFALDSSEVDLSTGAKQMSAYRCTASALSPSMTEIISQIDIANTISSWTNVMQGNMYLGVDATQSVLDPSGIMANILNVMMMVAGGGGSINRKQPTGTEIGCFFLGTNIHTGILIPIILLGILFVFMVGYWLYLFIAIKLAARRYDKTIQHDEDIAKSDDVLENTPNGLLAWMTHAAYESANTDARPKHEHFKKWRFSRLERHHNKVGITIPEDKEGVYAKPVKAAEVDSQRSVQHETVMMKSR